MILMKVVLKQVKFNLAINFIVFFTKPTMLLFWCSKKGVLLVLLMVMFLVPIMLQRQKVNINRNFVNFYNSSYRDDSQNETLSERISNLLRGLVKSEEEHIEIKVRRLRDIEKSKLNIFFIESRCGTTKTSGALGRDSGFVLSARQSCSLESAALLNPARPVYLLHTCPLAPAQPPAHARPLLQLPNVFLVPVSLADVLDGTPALRLHRQGLLEHSLYPVVHASDVLRLAVLWCFGGTYLDLDMLSLRPLDDLQSNFAGLESPKAIGNSILNFEPSGFGHQLLTKMLRAVNTSFDGQSWAANGPELITTTLLHECKASIQSVWQCREFHVYNHTVLYPLPWKNYYTVFNHTAGPEVVRSIKETGFTVHFWNRFSAEYEVRVGSSQAYALLARHHCPGLYNSCQDTF